MASNIFAPQLSDTTANTFVQGANVDTSGADLISKIGGLAVEGGRQLAVASLTDGSLDIVPKEALASMEEVDEVGQSMANDSINSLGKLAAARKAGLPLAQAKARATSILKTAKNDNAFFADDIQKEYNKFFGGAGASIFTPTAEEKAEAEYRANVTSTALKLGVSEELAEQRIEDNEQMMFDQKKITLTKARRELNGDEYLSFASSASNEARMNLSQALIADVNTNGALSPQRLLEYKQQLPLIESKLHKQLQRMAGGTKISARAYQDARKEIDDTIFSLKGLMDDSAMLNIVKDNQSILKNNFDSAVLKNFGALKAVKDSMGEVGVTKLLTAFQGNDELGIVLENDPFFKKVSGMVGQFEQDIAHVMGKGVNSLFGASDPEEKLAETAGFITMLGSKNLGSVVEEGLKVNPQAEQLFKDAAIDSPTSIALLGKGEYPALIARNPEQWRKPLESSLEGVVRQAKANLILAQGNVPSDFDIQEVEAVRNRGAFGVGSIVKTIRASGTGVDSLMQASVQSMAGLANKYPYLWKDEHESSLDYIRKLFNIEAGVLR